MQTPLQITFEGVGHSESIEARIREEAKKLDHMDEHITSARVVVAKPRKRHQTGDPYQIRIHLTVPGGADINVNHDPGVGKRHDNMKVAIQDYRDGGLAALRRISSNALLSRMGTAARAC
jgi:putative sigma-54 modulation protein